jgi:quercetin dioxygenase-like cupin family protein
MSEQQRQLAMTFYHMADAPSIDEDGIMEIRPVNIDPAAREGYNKAHAALGQQVKVLYKGPGPDGFSLVWSRFEAGFRLPRHSHDADCLYYVTAGELHMGTRVLKAGDGFFIKADAPYAYNAGPEGVEVLEFRTATSFDMKIRDTSVEDWKPFADAVRAFGAQWAQAAAGES